MKKALSFAVALGLVAGVASTASALTMDYSGLPCLWAAACRILRAGG